MLAQAIDEADLTTITPATYAAEWKWDGIRVQAVREDGVVRLYTRTGDDISVTFPDIVAGPLEIHDFRNDFHFCEECRGKECRHHHGGYWKQR